MPCLLFIISYTYIYMSVTLMCTNIPGLHRITTEKTQQEQNHKHNRKEVVFLLPVYLQMFIAWLT